MKLHSLKEHVMIPIGGLNLDRGICPQIAQADMPDFRKFAKEEGIGSKLQLISIDKIKPVQGHYEPDKVEKLVDEGRDKLNKLNMVLSRDHYCLDGHHRLLALLKLNCKQIVHALVFDANVNDLLTLMRQFPKVFYKGIK